MNCKFFPDSNLLLLTLIHILTLIVEGCVYSSLVFSTLFSFCDVKMATLEALADYQPKSADGKFFIPAVTELFKSFEFNFDQMFKQFRNEFVNLFKERDEKISRLQSENREMKLKIEKLENKIDENDAYERKDTVIISGKAVPPVDKDEDCTTLACELIKNKLNYVVSPTDISAVHRLGEKKASQGPDRRDIIMKFCRRNSKIDLISASRRMKVNQFYVNESLTPLRQTIAFILRKAKREFPEKISGCTTLEGKNYVWIPPPNPNAPGAKATRLAVHTHDRLTQFCEKTLGKPLSHFIETWTH